MMRKPSAPWRARTISLLVSSALCACSSVAPSPAPSGASGAAGALGSGSVIDVPPGGSSGASAGLGGGGAASGGAASGGAASGGASSAGAGSAAGAAGGGGSPTSTCHEAGPAGALTTRLPCVLSETGLYAADMTTLAGDVHPYTPSFQLWTDGATKKRWVALPAGTKIDTTDMDYWSFPAGTKLWKEFTRDGVRVETRLLQKQTSGAWYAVAYQWRADQKDADAVPNGVKDASGTPHDVPNSDDCLTCHSQMPDKALGFSAIQLAHAAPGSASEGEWTLDALSREGLLTSPPARPLALPADDLDRQFFGYLHGNCGHCHNPKGTANTQTGLDLWLKVEDLAGPLTASSVYEGIVGTDIVWMDAEHPAAPKRIAPGSLTNSALYQRFIEKGQSWSMPPLGTELVDPTGKKLFEDWIAATSSLAPP